MVDIWRRTRVLLPVFLVLAALLAPAQAAASTTDPALPAPTGHHPVGTATMRLVDTGRADPWRPERPYRELMVTFWYPALLPLGKRAPYMSPELSAAIIGQNLPGFDPDALSTVRTNAIRHALPGRHKPPLMVLSPGFGGSRTSLSTLAEDLASRGYAVVAIDHTYEAEVEFPGGRIERCRICGEHPPEFYASVVRSRVRDTSFVLDELGGLIDQSRIAMAGHSIGGASAVAAAGADPRIDAAVNMDGAMFDPPEQGMAKPILLLGARREGRPDFDPTWAAAWPRLAGWKRWLDLGTAGHWSFSDMHYLADVFPIREHLPPEYLEQLFGTMSGKRTVEITRAYVGAFADTHLRGRADPLLDGPSPEYPDVSFVRP